MDATGTDTSPRQPPVYAFHPTTPTLNDEEAERRRRTRAAKGERARDHGYMGAPRPKWHILHQDAMFMPPRDE